MNNRAKHLVNGQITDQVSVLDQGFRYGDGCFETMLVHNGAIRLWNRHYTRLRDSCSRLGINPDFNRVELEKELDTLIDGARRAVVRLTLTRGVSGGGYEFDQEIVPTRVTSLLPAIEHPGAYKENGVDVRICENRLSRNPRLAGIKHLNRLEQVLARAEWRDEFAEGLLCDDRGFVVEGTITNVFIVEGDSVATPLLDQCGVSGVMRSELMQQMEALGIRCVETHIDRDRLMGADECFLSNAVIGIWPVKKIDNYGLKPANISRILLREIENL